MSKITNKVSKLLNFTTPVVWLSGWTEVVPVHGRVEKGVTLFWRLPTGAEGVIVKVDGVVWGTYTALQQKLNVPYPNLARTLARDPVKVELRFKRKRAYTTLYIIDIPDIITLVLGDVVITRSAGTSAGDICPTGKYNTAVSATYNSGGGFHEIQYSDKYSSGLYKAIRIKVSPTGRPDVIYVIEPGVMPSGTNPRPTDKLYVEDACVSDLQGDFSQESTPPSESQKFGRNSSAAQNIDVKTFRNTDSDKMVIRITAPQAYAVEAKLHD